MKVLVHKKCGHVVEQAHFGGRVHWVCPVCRKVVRPISKSMKNPYYLIKGERREAFYPPEDRGKMKYDGDVRAIRDLILPDIESAHQVAKMAGLDPYMIADVKDDWGREPVFKSKEILEYEAQQAVEKDLGRQADLAKVERLGKSPRHFAIKRYGRVVIYAGRSAPDYRPGYHRGVRVYPTLYLAIPGRKRVYLDVDKYVTHGKVLKKNFMDNYAYLFGGSSPTKRSYSRRSGQFWGENKPGVYPEPLPTIANDLAAIKAEYDRIKREVWSNPHFQTQAGEVLSMDEATGRRLGLKRVPSWKIWKRPSGELAVSNPARRGKRTSPRAGSTLAVVGLVGLAWWLLKNRR